MCICTYTCTLSLSFSYMHYPPFLLQSQFLFISISVFFLPHLKSTILKRIAMPSKKSKTQIRMHALNSNFIKRYTNLGTICNSSKTANNNNSTTTIHKSAHTETEIERHISTKIKVVYPCMACLA